MTVVRNSISIAKMNMVGIVKMAHIAIIAKNK